MHLTRKPRALLVLLPFASFDRPSMGLSSLKAALNGAGFECDIEYANLDFASTVGLETYLFLSSGASTTLLLGDAVFSEALNGERVDFVRLFSECSHPLTPEPTSDVLNELRRVSNEANRFIERWIQRDHWREYDLVGFNTMFQLAPSLAFARALKEQIEPPLVALGGSQCEGEMGLAIHQSYPWIDFVCRGEGEALIVKLCRYLAGDRTAVRSIPGLIHRGPKGESIANGPRTPMLNVEKLPSPKFDDWFG